MNKYIIIATIVFLVLFLSSIDLLAKSKDRTKLNNPFNIKKSSFDFYGRTQESSKFESFKNIELATAAFFKLIDRNYIKKGYDTIETMMYRYAPPDDGNDTEKYINYICRETGIGRTDKINIQNFKTAYGLAKAITFFESGFKLDKFATIRAHRFYMTFYR